MGNPPMAPPRYHHHSSHRVARPTPSLAAPTSYNTQFAPAQSGHHA
jgi:hypothetical protein